MRRPTAPRYIANFDSAAAMLRATARYLRGKDFPLLGIWPKASEPMLRYLGAGINALPRRLSERIYIWSGWGEAIPPEQLGSVRAEQVAEWVVGE
jgi:hypothetical protein